MASNYVTISTDLTIKGLTNTIKLIDKNSIAALKLTAELAKVYAQSIAPRNSGDTANAITWTTGKTDKMVTVIFGKGHRMGSGFNLTHYMNETGKFKSGRKVPDTYWSGEPRFVEATTKEVKKSLKRNFRRLIQK